MKNDEFTIITDGAKADEGKRGLRAMDENGNIDLIGQRATYLARNYNYDPMQIARALVIEEKKSIVNEPTHDDIIPRLYDLAKWYGFIQSTEQMIESNQIIIRAATEIQNLRRRAGEGR
jgi:hypothetical protein